MPGQSEHEDLQWKNTFLGHLEFGQLVLHLDQAAQIKGKVIRNTILQALIREICLLFVMMQLLSPI